VSKTYALLFLVQVGESPIDDFPEKPLVNYYSIHLKKAYRPFVFPARNLSRLCSLYLRL